MLLAKFSPNPAVLPDEYRTTPAFTELSAKVGYTFELPYFESGLEIFAGVKNIAYVYQKDFDNYRNRDSNYVYGPSTPRTFYMGLKLMAL